MLHVVAESGHLETAKYLVEFCQTARSGNLAKQSRSKQVLDINAVNSDKKTALQIAAEKGESQ